VDEHDFKQSNHLMILFYPCTEKNSS